MSSEFLLGVFLVGCALVEFLGALRGGRRMPEPSRGQGVMVNPSATCTRHSRTPCRQHTEHFASISVCVLSGV